MNNTQNNKAPLFLTANHCVGAKDSNSDSDLSDWVFYWGYELENCSSTTQPYYYNKTTIGATLIANNSYSDFALLQLQQDPLNLPGYIPYYLGWDASGYSGTGGVCIHHPNYDVKKISTYSCVPQTVAFNSSPTVYWGVQWIATTNGHGITEPGSSGSPLINHSHRVIGQLRGGNLNCSYLSGSSIYGKLSVSWSSNGNNDYRRRLNHWLDPNGTNTQYINGLSPYNLSGPSIICSSSTGSYTISGLPSYYTVIWSLSDGIGSTPPVIQSSGNSCIVTNNGTYSYMGTLNANIYYNNNLVITLQKQITTYSNFYGVYDNNKVLLPNNLTVWVDKGNHVRIVSPNLVHKNVTYSVTTPVNPQYYGATGELILGYPTGSSNSPILVSIQNDSFYSNCDNSYLLTVLPTSLLPVHLISVNSQGETINIRLISKIDNEEQEVLKMYDIQLSDKIDLSWTVEIYNISTGNKKYTQTISGNSVSLNTSGWKQGLYAVRVTIGKEVLTEKIQIK